MSSSFNGNCDNRVALGRRSVPILAILQPSAANIHIRVECLLGDIIARADGQRWIILQCEDADLQPRLERKIAVIVHEGAGQPSHRNGLAKSPGSG